MPSGGLRSTLEDPTSFQLVLSTVPPDSTCRYRERQLEFCRAEQHSVQLFIEQIISCHDTTNQQRNARGCKLDQVGSSWIKEMLVRLSTCLADQKYASQIKETLVGSCCDLHGSSWVLAQQV